MSWSTTEIEESSDSVDTQHNYELNGKNFEFSEPECPTLPNVPEDSPWDILDHDELHENVVGRSGPELDDEILTSLTKLKFFSNAWGEPVVTNTEKVEAVATEDTVAYANSESDRLEFNRWYYEEINKATTKDPYENRVDMSTITMSISNNTTSVIVALL